MLGPKSTAGEKLAQYPQDNRLPQGLAVCEQVFEGGPIPAEADRQLKSIAQVRENNEKNTSFVDCSYHSDFGGGVFGNSSGITLTIDSSTFISNSATMGGGIYIACPAIITRTAILSNTASTLGGGIRIDKLALHCHNQSKHGGASQKVLKYLPMTFRPAVSPNLRS